jgi:type IV pilus assembly protein PilY1|nr:PilC/PilY family type IV pilus protein [Candidatus Krumholzibacteria bacterium]
MFRIESAIAQTRRRTMVAVLLVGVLLVGALAPGQVMAQDCEVPLFVQQSLIGANVMIVADNSGSMNTIVFHDAYDEDVTYTGDFNSWSTYNISTDGFRTPSSFNAAWPIFPPVFLVNSDGGQNGQYPGNYLNWIYYHAGVTELLKIPQVTRIQVLKEVLSDIVDRSEKLDFGITIFNGSSGGTVLAPCGTPRDEIVTRIQAITANAWTPLGETLEDVLDYFSETGIDAAISEPCQYNFCLVMTDGLPTQDVDVSPYLFDADQDGEDPGSCTTIGAPYSNASNCSDHLDDVAYYMAHEDLRGDMDGDQQVYSYTIGFNLDNKLLVDTAKNGDGLYFKANNAVELFLSFEYAVQDILRRISAGSAVAVVSTERGTDNRLYRGKFMPLDWHGYLECYTLPYHDGDVAMWEAGNLLQARSPLSREVFTALGKDYYYFSAAQAPLLKAAMGVFTDEKAEDLINWARGEDVSGLRDRNGWILGDIIHSTPVVVGEPANFQATEEYRDFHVANEFRRKMVYVGANDGMLHAFDAETGEEVWAFVPEFALPKFEALADSGYCHTYTCDQTVTVRDIPVNGAWRTILMSGGREGGGSIFAMDVTNPNSPSVLWQQKLDNGKPFESVVEIVSIGGKATALVGSGLDTEDDNAYIYSFDIATGDFMGELQLNKGSFGRNKATKPLPLDLTMDGDVDLVYIADLESTLWRFEVNGDQDPGHWNKDDIFEDLDREITADPVAAYGKNGEVYIYFGTGAYLSEDDKLDVAPQSFVCVVDVHDGQLATRSDLVDQTSSITPVTGSRGWYVDLWHTAGERVTQKAMVVAETVIFTSFAPTMDACLAGGQSWLYQMAYDSGGLTNSDEMTDVEDRSISLGNGIASYPVIDLATGNVVVQSSDASISVTPISAIYQRMTVRAWQENYDGVDTSFLP